MSLPAERPLSGEVVEGPLLADFYLEKFQVDLETGPLWS